MAAPVRPPRACVLEAAAAGDDLPVLRLPVLLDGDDQPEDAGRGAAVAAGLAVHADARQLLAGALRRPGRLALINSLIVAVCTTAAVDRARNCPAAYALARFEFRGKQDLWFWFITNRFVSPVVLAFPVFLISREFGLRDTHIALILMYLTFSCRS